MTEEQLEEIGRLTIDSFQKNQRFKRLLTMNTPTDYNERMAAKVELELARREMLDAYDAIDRLFGNRGEPISLVYTQT